MVRRIAILTVVVAAMVGPAAYADPIIWNGLTVGQSYNLTITEPVTYWGGIRQFNEMGSNIAVTAAAGYTLPSISVLNVAGVANPFWGVCIDTAEWSASQEGAILQQGWANDPYPVGPPVGTAGRLNGTVLNQDSWMHTTYLFSQYNSQMGAMSTEQKAAFQLATWEVLSGDGALGAGWADGNFQLQSLNGPNTVAVMNAANAYVAAAFDEDYANWSASLAQEAFYFSGVSVSSGGQGPHFQDFLV